jgi:hypothetical protein
LAIDKAAHIAVPVVPKEFAVGAMSLATTVVVTNVDGSNSWGKVVLMIRGVVKCGGIGVSEITSVTTWM